MTAVHGHERPYDRCPICKRRYCPEDEDCDCNPDLTEKENRELAGGAANAVLRNGNNES